MPRACPAAHGVVRLLHVRATVFSSSRGSSTPAGIRSTVREKRSRHGPLGLGSFAQPHLPAATRDRARAKRQPRASPVSGAHLPKSTEGELVSGFRQWLATVPHPGPAGASGGGASP